MKARYFILMICLFLAQINAKGQLKNVYIEKYYVSNDSDATDTSGSRLASGSVTYRLFIGMNKGCKLTQIFGEKDHPLIFTSDSIFYNNTLDGTTFGYLANYTRLKEGTVPLDTWITLGEVSLAKPTGKTYFGVPKTEDRNGSIIGGPKNNNGGSASLSSGLLVNPDTAQFGYALTSRDGLDTLSKKWIPANWTSNGIVDVNGNDSTIFGSLKKGKVFNSTNVILQNSGVIGVSRDSNQVIIAQLTTKGGIKFHLNVEIWDTIAKKKYRYVAVSSSNDSLNAINATKQDRNNLPVIYAQNANLIYPIPCGCTDPNYIEYNPAAGCNEPNACKTPIVLGCMDHNACNFDPSANFHIASVCCYPGFCNNRDITLVCPRLGVDNINPLSDFTISPNPAQSSLLVNIPTNLTGILSTEIFDLIGNLVFHEVKEANGNSTVFSIPLEGIANGFYTLKIQDQKNIGIKKFIKQ